MIHLVTICQSLAPRFYCHDPLPAPCTLAPLPWPPPPLLLGFGRFVCCRLFAELRPFTLLSFKERKG